MATSLADFQNLDLSGDKYLGGDETNSTEGQWYKIARATKGLASVWRTKISTGTEPDDIIEGYYFGDQPAAKVIQYRLFYDNVGNDFKLDRNTNTDASPVWDNVWNYDEASDTFYLGATTFYVNEGNTGATSTILNAAASQLSQLFWADGMIPKWSLAKTTGNEFQLQDTASSAATRIRVISGNHSDNLVLAANGNVGINTATPGAQFDVNGVIRATSSGDASVKIEEGAASQTADVVFTANGPIDTWRVGKDASGAFRIYDDVNNNDIISIAAAAFTDAIQIDATGIGFFNTTPAAKPTAITQTYSTTATDHLAPTAATLTDSSGGGATDNTIGAITIGGNVGQDIPDAVAELADEVNKLITDLANTKDILNQVIDNLQSIGLTG